MTKTLQRPKTKPKSKTRSRTKTEVKAEAPVRRKPPLEWNKKPLVTRSATAKLRSYRSKCQKYGVVQHTSLVLKERSGDPKVYWLAIRYFVNGGSVVLGCEKPGAGICKTRERAIGACEQDNQPKED